MKLWKWGGLGAASLVAVAILATVPDGFGGLEQTVTLDRAGALSQARQFTQKLALGPEGAQQALSFATDNQAQAFVELKGGGLGTLNAETARGTYTPGRWTVRQFREGEVTEVSVFLGPGGRVMGWSETLPQDQVRPNLDEAAAKDKALGTLWEVDHPDLDTLVLAETTSVTQPQGRVDRTFTWERTPSPFGEGRLQWAVTVSGDRVTQVNPYLKVPESFRRWFENERSTNNLIGTFSVVGILALTVLAGWVALRGGRKKQIAWKRAWVVAAVLALGATVGQVNGLTQAWMGYDTAQPGAVFWVTQLVTWVLVTAVLTLFQGLTLAGADGVFRRAFPGFVGLGTPGGLATVPPARLTRHVFFAALAIPLWLLYVVGFYALTKGSLGWWTPASALADPNIVGQAVPWLTPFGNALQAGVWEEVFFRALPLALAVLAGRRWGHKTLWVASALVGQALVFAAGHASYPGLPGYSRLVELILPALAFGFIQLRWGLVPAILIHFGYDFVLMSQPLFTTDAPSLVPDRIAVVLVALALPVAALVRLWRSRGRPGVPAPAEAPPVIEEPRPASPAPGLASVEVPGAPTGTSGPRPLAPAVGVALTVVGLAAWALTLTFPVDTLKVDRDHALWVARQALADRGVTLPATWTLDVTAGAEAGDDDRLVRERGGEDAVKAFRAQGSIMPPRWIVQWSDYTGDPKMRERWVVTVADPMKPFRVIHQVPEAMPGKSLTLDEARVVAFDGVRRLFSLDPEGLVAMGSAETKQPARSDWDFDFSVPAESRAGLDARLHLRVSGDQVTDAYRTVFQPEAWVRDRKAVTSVSGLILTGCGLAWAVLVGWGIVRGFRSWSRRTFSIPAFVATTLVTGLSLSLGYFNNWAPQTAQFNLAQPWADQALQQGLLMPLLFGLVGLALGLVAGTLVPPGARWTRPRGKDLAIGLALGVAWAGGSGLVNRLFPSGTSDLPAVDPASALLPWVHTPLMEVSGLLMLLILVVFLFDRARGTKRPALGAALVFTAAALAGGFSSEPWLTLVGRMVLGGALALGIWFLARDRPRSLAALLGGTSLLGQVVTLGMSPYPGAWVGALVTLVTTLALVWGLSGWLGPHRGVEGPGQGVADGHGPPGTGPA